MSRPIIPPPLPPFVSPSAAGLATAIVSLLVAGASWSPHGRGSAHLDIAPTEVVRYLLPLMPPHLPVRAAAPIPWVPDVSGIKGINGSASGSGGGGLGTKMPDEGGGVPVAAAPTASVDVPDLPDSTLVGGKVYIEAQTDEPVQRDPGSAAPAYPAFLERQHIEGTVTVSYVVDTTGFADSVSMKVKSVSHQAFADAVRAALPGMHFHPALLAGRPV
jgi:TonB family protein